MIFLLLKLSWRRLLACCLQASLFFLLSCGVTPATKGACAMSTIIPIPLNQQLWEKAKEGIVLRAWASNEPETRTEVTNIWAFRVFGDGAGVACGARFLSNPHFVGIYDPVVFQGLTPHLLASWVDKWPLEIKDPREWFLCWGGARCLGMGHLFSLIPLMLFEHELRNRKLENSDVRRMQQELLALLSEKNATNWRDLTGRLG